VGASRIVAGCAALVAAVALLMLSPAPTLAAPARTGTPPSTGRPHVDNGGSAHAKPAAEIPDPPANNDPSLAFFEHCYPSPAAGCDAAALSDFDAARALEGLGPMTLPTTFDTMPAAEQLLVLADIDRVDHGLIPVQALSAPINSLAAAGALADDDPSFPSPFYGHYGGSNWAGAGSSTLLAEFLWVYDDGVGSGNEDCTEAGDPGCWGHRHNILENSLYIYPLLMGAAETTADPDHGSIAEEFISGDNKDTALDPTWASLQSLFPVGLSTTSLAVSNTVAQTVPITAWASGVAMNVTADVTAGAGAWSVSPASCALAAGEQCTLDVTWDPASGSATTGTLAVTGPNGTRDVTLVASSGTPPPPPPPTADLAAAATQPTVVGGASRNITGRLTDANSDLPLVGHPVIVEARPAGTPSWIVGGTSETTAAGAVSITVRPLRNTSYRLVAAATDGYAAVISNTVRLTVRPVVTVALHHRRVAAKTHEKLRVTSMPGLGGQRITLQRRVHGVWTAVAHARLSSTGHHAFTVHFSHLGTDRYRVIEPATSQHAMARSHPLVITID
jgi:hypothetical protein